MIVYGEPVLKARTWPLLFFRGLVLQRRAKKKQEKIEIWSNEGKASDGVPNLY